MYLQDSLLKGMRENRCALALHSVAEYLSKKEIVVLFPYPPNPEPRILDPQTLNPTPQTPNPKLYMLNPEP